MGCDYRGNIEGPAWKAVMDYAYDEAVWIEDFLVAWDIATSNSLRYVQAQDADAATRTRMHFTNGVIDGNCGCCREKALTEDDEGFEGGGHLFQGVLGQQDNRSCNLAQVDERGKARGTHEAEGSFGEREPIGRLDGQSSLGA